MKKTCIILIGLCALGPVAYAENGGPDAAVASDVKNDITTNQNQNASASGGDAASDSRANSNANVDLTTNSTSNYQTRTPPLTTFPPYLPNWGHAGWGTIKAYFPNGPTPNDQIYETTFDPKNPDDQHELRSVLKALPHKGVLAVVGGALNDVAVAMFGKPDTYFHGRGIEIADSIVRDRRPEGKCLLVFIDSNVDMNLLGEEGYAYVGKVSVEADPDRNWDQGYKAAVAEALLWDVDILLISGGMKGVTTGTNVTSPSAAGGYSQVNYSLSLMGSKAKGITEGKGKAMISAEAYRYNPQMLERRRIPAEVYERIRYRPPMPPLPCDAFAPVPPAVAPIYPETPAPSAAPACPPVPEPQSEVEQQATPPVQTPAAVPAPAPAPAATPGSAAVAPAYAPYAPAAAVRSLPPSPRYRRPAPARPSQDGPGISMSRELFDLAGYPNDQQVGYVNIR